MKKRGQIWVETVVYTLIAFALIGLVLAFVKPKIEEIQDKAVLDQSAGILEEIDSIVKNLGSPGNQRLIELGISKGKMTKYVYNDEELEKLNKFMLGREVRMAELKKENEELKERINNLTKQQNV